MILISQNNSAIGIRATLIDNEVVEFVFLYFMCFVRFYLLELQFILNFEF